MRQQTEILQDIARFQPVDGMWLPLDHLLDELWSVGLPSESLAILFGVFERFPQDDGAGVLWSIVHGIESLPYSWESELLASVERKPCGFNVMMINRILNTQPPDAESWMALLRSVADNPAASDETKADAKEYIEYQVDQARARVG